MSGEALLWSLFTLCAGYVFGHFFFRKPRKA